MIQNVKIHIGQYFASKDSISISTILGSCVSVCLFDPVIRIGGMNHILHTGESLGEIDDSGRYGINAMELLINEMVALGAVRYRLVAKIFGGGNILGLSKKNQQGYRNVDFVLNFLETDEIKVVAQNTGGRFSRKIFFQTDTSEVLLKKTTSKMQANFAQEKNTASIRVKSISDESGEITLF